MDAAHSEILSLPGGPARVQWRRSLRARRVSLRIDPRGAAVVVTLPPRAARTAGVALLMNHADWVSERLAALPVAVAFEAGAAVPLHGVDHPIRHVARVSTSRASPRCASAAGRLGSRLVWVERGEICVPGEAEFIARRVADFLRAEARRRLSALVAQKAALAGVQPRRITVKDTRSRWGSCAANGNLAFSWRLVMAPRFVQDYVAAHEVAHLRHMNHGARFWALVDQLTPHTSAAMVWLRTQGPSLLRIG